MNSPIIPTGRSKKAELAASGTTPVQDPTFYLPKVEPSRFIGSILRRGWIILLFGLLAGAGAWAFFSKMPKKYRSTGSVYVSTQAPRVLDIQAVAAQETSDLEDLHSVEQDLASNTVLLRVIDEHELLGDRTFAPKAETRQQVLKVLADRVDVELVRGSRHIGITVEDTDPERARQLVESVMNEYEEVSAERISDLTEQAGVGLAREEKRLRLRMEESAAAAEAFRKENAVPGLDDLPGAGSLRSELSTLRDQLTRAKAERLRLEAEYAAFSDFDGSDPDALAGLGRSDHAVEVLSLVRSLREREVEFERLKERYLHKHPKYIEASNEIVGLNKALNQAVVTAGEAVQKSYRIAVENQTKLEREVALASSSAVDNEGVRAEFAELRREAAADRELHASVAKRLRETSLTASVPASILSWRERPLAPERASSPQKMLLVPIAAMGGAFFGLFAVIGLELGDRRVRDAAAVSRATGSPLLARIPRMKDGGSAVVIADPNSEAAESFRQLRTMLSPTQANDRMQTVIFTSARHGEGKSVCAYNHAVALASQGHRTLLLDADLRSPGLSCEHLADGPGRGLGSFLAGEAQAADACFRTAMPKLFLMSSGEMKENAAELLAGTRFPALLEDAYRWFDRVVIDAPGVLTSSDAQTIARYADRTCLVVDGDGSSREDLQKASELLRSTGANLVGFVWNEGSGQSGVGPSVTVAREAIETTPEEVAVVDLDEQSPQPSPKSGDETRTIPFPIGKEA
ncbi:MAG: polysaccharide biosynthesis tyrosine autokinase [Verrucomicrobiota bacterium]